MARRILNRKDLRADYDAAERRKTDEDEVEDEEEDSDEEESDEADEEAEGEEDEAEEEAEEEAPVKPKKKPKKAAEPKPKRVRTPKVVRMKVVWGVFSNSNQRVASYDYPKKKEAEEHAAKLMADKKQTFFVQPVKEPIEEKKEKE
jgi:cobalamin biosynthesis protein CobT